MLIFKDEILEIEKEMEFKSNELQNLDAEKDRDFDRIVALEKSIKNLNTLKSCMREVSPVEVPEIPIGRNRCLRPLRKIVERYYVIYNYHHKDVELGLKY